MVNNTGTYKLLLLLLLAMPLSNLDYRKSGNGTPRREQVTLSPLNLMAPKSMAQTSGQILSAYQCPIPEERVYISLAGDRYNPGTLSVGLGALIIWSSYGNPLPTSSHTITANTTANGPTLPFFNATLAPLDQWAYTFNVPGTYYYYDKYVASNKGVISVHPRAFVGNSVLGVTESQSNPNIIVNRFNVNSSTSFTVNIVAANVASLSSFEICLQYDTNTAQETSLTLAPTWDAAYNPNALGGASISTGDGTIQANSFILNGGPGGNATGITRLFSVTFNALNYGYGTLQLTGYLIDSNGNYISYVQQNGSYRVIPIAALYYLATYPGQPLPGSNVTVHDTFENIGQSLERVTSAQISTDFGIFRQSIGLPVNMTSLSNATLSMPMAIPRTTSPGVHQVTLSANWQYLRVNQTSGASSWVDASTLSGSGTITIRLQTDPSSIVTNFLAEMISSYWSLIILGAIVTWIALATGAIGLFITDRREMPQIFSWNQTERTGEPEPDP